MQKSKKLMADKTAAAVKELIALLLLVLKREYLLLLVTFLISLPSFAWSARSAKVTSQKITHAISSPRTAHML